MFGLTKTKEEEAPPPQVVTVMGPYGSYPQCTLCGWQSAIDKTVRCCPKCGSTEVTEIIGRWSYREYWSGFYPGVIMPHQEKDKFHPKEG